MKAVFWNQRNVGGNYLKWNLWDTVTTDLEEFKNSPATLKVAMIGEFLEGMIVYPTFIEHMDELLTFCDKIFVFNTHAFDEIVPYLEKYYNPKIIWVLPIIHHYNQQIIFDNSWLRSKVEWYSAPELKEDLFKLTPYDTKEFYFDAMMRSGDGNKDHVIDNVKLCGIGPKVLSRFGSEPVLYPEGFTDRTMISELASYKGHECVVADVVPVDLYNKSAYSILAESTYLNSFFYLTEKTTKCILARRLFVMFAGQYWLRSFRNLGFKTFSDIIDESYDDIEDNQTRWSIAFNQIKYLCEQPQDLILDKIKPIVEHNYNHLWTTNWRGTLDQQILDVINMDS